MKEKNAETWLDHLLACQLPKTGRMCLAPMLKQDGKIIGDFTVAKLADNKYLLVGSGAAEEYHMRWFEQHLVGYTDVDVKSEGLDLVGLSIAGPQSRALLQVLTREDVSAESFRFMDIKQIDIGMAPTWIGRVSYTGDLGFEIWMKPAYQRYVFEMIMEAGQDYSLRLFGLRALNALRLEKGFGSWAREYRPIYTPFECALDRFISLNKPADFIGKTAATTDYQSGGGKRRLRTFIIDATQADAIGDEPIFHNGEVHGWITSGGYAHHSQCSVAMGFVPVEIADELNGWEVEILGERLTARLQTQPLFDAKGSAMRN